VIIADTGAVLALIDADERHHEVLRALFEDAPDAWLLPWAILPEVDYLLLTHLGPAVEAAFLADLADGRWAVTWGDERDLARARDIARTHASLRLGLVDGVVIATAERLGADAIATLDLRHFGAVRIRGNPRLVPRDL
jgi:predicted nucleic acid-binding protein